MANAYGIYFNYYQTAGQTSAAILKRNTIAGHSGAGILIDGTNGAEVAVTAGGSLSDANTIENNCGYNVQMVNFPYPRGILAPRNYWGATCEPLVLDGLSGLSHRSGTCQGHVLALDKCRTHGDLHQHILPALR